MAKKNLNRTGYSNKRLLDKITELNLRLSQLETNDRCSSCPWNVDYSLTNFKDTIYDLSNSATGYLLNDALHAVLDKYSTYGVI